MILLQSYVCKCNQKWKLLDKVKNFRSLISALLFFVCIPFQMIKEEIKQITFFAEKRKVN